MDATDLKISRRLKKVLRKTEELVQKEVGERCGVALIVFPFTRPGEASRVAEYQYICNTRREQMHAIIKGIAANWDKTMNHVAPHDRGLN